MFKKSFEKNIKKILCEHYSKHIDISIFDINKLYISSDYEKYITIYGDIRTTSKMNLFFGKVQSLLMSDLKKNLYDVELIEANCEISQLNILFKLINMSNISIRDVYFFDIYLSNDLHPVSVNARILNSRNNKEKEELLLMVHDKYEVIEPRYLFSTGTYSVIKSDLEKFIIKYESGDNKYIVKINQSCTNKKVDEYEFEESINEAFVGIVGLNYLRKILPNFALVHKIFLNNPFPISYHDSNNIIDNLNDGNLYNFVYYEYIEGEDMKHFILKCTLYEFINVYKQIIYSLYEAYKLFQFTHYDLHTNNIIIKKLNESITINYDGPVLECTNLATIIDYGSSHIKYKNKDYGRIFYEGNVNNNELWAHDIFKLLFYCYYKCKNNKIQEYISKSMKFFICEDLNPELCKKFKDINQYFALRCSSKVLSLIFKDYIDYVNSI